MEETDFGDSQWFTLVLIECKLLTQSYHELV